MNKWRSIEENPDGPVNAVLWFPEIEVYKNEGRADFELAYWDGKAWYFNGTNHEVHEYSDSIKPARWFEIPNP